MKLKLLLRYIKITKKVLLMFTLQFVLSILISCQNASPPEKDVKVEEYIWVGSMISDPMFVNNDIAAFKQFGEEYGVTISIMGPKKYDIAAQISALNDAIDKKPAGILVLGMERSLTSTVNKGIRLGIPIITVDADLQDSERVAFVGSNWYDIGVSQAEEMVKLIGGKGQVALMGILGADNMEMGFNGFKSVIENYPDIVIVGEFDDMASVAEAERLTESIIEQYPSISGIAGFDTNSAVGIASGINNSKISNDIKVTAMDIEPENLELIYNNEIDFLVGQKRPLFTYFGAKLLYDLNHSTINITNHDKTNNITQIPEKIYTGLIEVDYNNINQYIQ